MRCRVFDDTCMLVGDDDDPEGRVPLAGRQVYVGDCGGVLCVVAVACSAPRGVEPARTCRPPYTGVARSHAPSGLIRPPSVPDVRAPGRVVGMRWLPRRPSLEPHADLASIYRVDGAWTQLCTARGHPRGVDADEAVAYAIAWCAVRTGDAVGRETIARLRSAKSPKLAEAAWWDTIDLVAEYERDVDAAAPLLGYDEAALDALAATYVELDRRDDARVVLAILDTRTAPIASPRRCRRLALKIELDVVRLDLDEVPSGRSWPDADRACRDVIDDLACPLVSGGWPPSECRDVHCATTTISRDLDACEGLVRAEPSFRTIVLRSSLVVRWPMHEATAKGWLVIAEWAMQLLDLDRGPEIVIAALENAARFDRCGPIADAARAIPRAKLDGDALLARLDKLIAGC